MAGDQLALFGEDGPADGVGLPFEVVGVMAADEALRPGRIWTSSFARRSRPLDTVRRDAMP